MKEKREKREEKKIEKRNNKKEDEVAEINRRRTYGTAKEETGRRLWTNRYTSTTQRSEHGSELKPIRVITKINVPQ